MARQLSVGQREISAVENAYDVYLVISARSVIAPEDDEWMRGALSASMTVSERTDAALDLIRSAIETAMEGRRFKRRLRDYFTVIRGGIP